MERVNYKGWENCLRITNNEIELIVTTDVGPRIIFAGFCGGQNFFKNFDAMMGLTGGEEWRIYGGHRLWHAPEVSPRTYAPDNEPVSFTEKDGALILNQPVEQSTGIEKSIEIKMESEGNVVLIDHVLTNRNPWAVELAPWTLSVMAPGGFAIVPQEEYRPHPDCLHPARPMVLWHFTTMSDPRWTWGDKYVLLRQDPQAGSKQKCGMLNKQQWAAYCLGDETFVKRYPFLPDAAYTDYGCNTELYTDPDFLEVESLGPLQRIEPGASIRHPETWLFSKTAIRPEEGDIDEKMNSLLATLSLEAL